MGDSLGHRGVLWRQNQFRRKKKAQELTLHGKRVIVTAGPCREPIDPVRYISNRSSGKMGYALAVAARDAGADVCLISGPTNLIPPTGVEFDAVETTAEMYDAVSSRFTDCHALIMAAAPADFAPKSAADEKIKKASAELDIELSPTVDILKAMGKRKSPGQILIGFALETQDGIANARKKLHDKNLDLIVLNNVRDEGAGFDHDTNRVTIIRSHDKSVVWPLMSKSEVANRLLSSLASML